MEYWVLSRTTVEMFVLLDNKKIKPMDYVEIGIDAEVYNRIKDAKKGEIE